MHAGWQERDAARLNKMENPSFLHDSEAGQNGGSTVELGDMDHRTHNCPPSCVSLQKQAMISEKQLPESPWHQLKTIFLVGMLLLLSAWLVIYITLNQLEML